MKLGISGQALGSVMPFLDIVKIAKKYNVFDFEIWPENVPGDGTGYSMRDINYIKKIMSDENIKIYTVTLGDAFSGNIDLNKYSEALSSTVTAAANLGAKCVNHYYGNLASSEKPEYDLLEQAWSKPLLLAEKYGITLALENEAHDATRTPDKMLKIIEYFKNDYFKTNLDCTNYFQANCAGFPDAYDILKNEIGYVHIKNAMIDSNGEFKYVPIPKGSVNIPGLLTKIINDNSYNRVVTLEPHTDVKYVEDYYKEESAWLYSLGYFK